MPELVRERAPHRRREHCDEARARQNPRACNPPQPFQVPEPFSDEQMNVGAAWIVRVELNPRDRRLGVDDGRGRAVDRHADEATVAISSPIDDTPGERHAGVTPDRVGLGQHRVDERAGQVRRRVHADRHGWERRRDGQCEYGEHGGQLTGTTRAAARG